MPLHYRDELTVTCVHGHISYLGESVTRFFDVSVQVATPNEGHFSSHLHEFNFVCTAASPHPFPRLTHRGRKGRGTTIWTARLIYWNKRWKGSCSSPTCSHFLGFLGVRNGLTCPAQGVWWQCLKTRLLPVFDLRLTPQLWHLIPTYNMTPLDSHPALGSDGWAPSTGRSCPQRWAPGAQYNSHTEGICKFLSKGLNLWLCNFLMNLSFREESETMTNSMREDSLPAWLVHRFSLGPAPAHSMQACAVDKWVRTVESGMTPHQSQAQRAGHTHEVWVVFVRKSLPRGWRPASFQYNVLVHLREEKEQK